ncbi:TatD family hydrolase [Roseimarinus sediminis]|uniref:TatD family hydrolase n=1 Tax=Roseimarinus sediminis TaxID=1610899 RepID=UPI003D21B6DD
MLIDTHSHIYSEEFNGEAAEVIKRADDKGVNKILLPNIDSSSIKMMLDLADRYPERCYPMIGLHPTSVKEDYREELELVEYWLKRRKFYGIGEIGIDLYWEDTFREEQEYVFMKQLGYALAYDLPVSIHTRDSFDLAIGCIEKANEGGRLRGVFHCFTGDVDQAQKAIALGLKIGVGGIVTFKNAGIDQVIAQLSPNDLLLETDAPYLAPVPFRGKRNESAHLVYVLKKVASLFDIGEDEMAAITTRNASLLFGV